MYSTYQKLFLQLEAQRHIYLDWVMAKPEEKQQQVPAPGQWSAAQILYHLAQIDQQVVSGLENSLQKGKALRNSGTGTSFRSMLLNLFLRLPLKFKAPKVLGEMPQQIQVPEVVKNWEGARVRLKKFLEDFPPELRGKEIFRHPRSGMLTTGQTLSFLYEHHQHHQAQLKRVLS